MAQTFWKFVLWVLYVSVLAVVGLAVWTNVEGITEAGRLAVVVVGVALAIMPVAVAKGFEW